MVYRGMSERWTTMSVMQTVSLTPSEATDEVLRTFRRRGTGELRLGITEQEHAAQCAALAQRAGFAPALVAACLLHDYGRLLDGPPETHAERGADALSEVFGPAVAEPIRLHTDAWRYLAAVEPDFAPAHPAGGRERPATQPTPMDGSEVRAFLRRPWATEAATVRRIDECGRLAGIDSPPLEEFRGLLKQLANRHLMLGG
jgi:gamma-butyrobetaine dioxygenase